MAAPPSSWWGPCWAAPGLAPTGQGTVLLFGGFEMPADSSGRPPEQGSLGDTWEWNGNTAVWRKLAVSPRPGPRESTGLVFDSARRRNVLFGGGQAEMGVVNPLDDTWEFVAVAAP